MAKLVAIGDSLTQGFQSGAIIKTDRSYPVMIARSLGLSVPTDFPIPTFAGNGSPINIERLLSFLAEKLGDEISIVEWLFRFPDLLGKFIDETEDLYERGQASKPSSFTSEFHNLAVWGFRVGDAFNVTSNYCDRIIQTDRASASDDTLIPSGGLPSQPMYRTARAVLNPSADPAKGDWTQIDNLKAINEREGVENLILWYGANDCLGTVVSLKIDRMPDNFASEDPEERRKFNLTSPTVFRRDYETLIAKVKDAISPNTKVFVGTIPAVTIPPVTKGIGPLPSDSKYFPYYGKFFMTEDNFSRLVNSNLTGTQAEEIDATIAEYNRIIRQLVDAEPNWQIVDTGKILADLAVKRNRAEKNPSKPLEEYYQKLGLPNHPLLQLDPIPSILMLETKDRTRTNGGFFSLDGVHPSTIGYGIVAEAFLREMQTRGVANADPANLDWGQIIDGDSLLQQPPVLWDDIVRAAQNNSLLWDIVFRFIA